MPEKIRNAVVYARLSKDKTKDHAGVDRQLEDARALAKMRDYRVIAEYVDNDISAAGKKVRPGFEQMLKALAAGECDVVIAWAWDRLSRNRRDGLRIMELGQSKSLTIALVRGSDLDMASANGRLIADMLASVARNEIDAKGERQERAERQRAEQGRPPSRRAFGYLQSGERHPEEAPIVAEVFALYLAGATMKSISNKLAAEGVRTARGNAWHDTGIRVMLTNPRYVGERYYHEEHIAKGTWEPLVTVETFEAVQSKLVAGTKPRRPARRYLGGGLFRCHCGSVVKVSYDGHGTRVYVCSARSHMQRKADPVDDLVYRVIVELLRRADLADLLNTGGPHVDIAGLRQEAIGYRGRIDSLALDYADGNLNARQLSVATARIEGKLAEVEATLAEVSKSSAVASIANAPDLGDAWLALPLDRQRAVLDCIATVKILPGRLGRGAFDPQSVLIQPVS